MTRAAAVLAVLLAAGCSPQDSSADAGPHSSGEHPLGDAGPTGRGSGSDWPDPSEHGRPPCAALVDRCCGAGTVDAIRPCFSEPQCEAARILHDHAMDGRCQAALRNLATYPACGQDTGCGQLVVRCCGGIDGGACAQQATCARAHELWSAAGAGQREACLQALEDPASFPPCPPP